MEARGNLGNLEKTNPSLLKSLEFKTPLYTLAALYQEPFTAVTL
jgi:hypothetical protein